VFALASFWFVVFAHHLSFCSVCVCSGGSRFVAWLCFVGLWGDGCAAAPAKRLRRRAAEVVYPPGRTAVVFSSLAPGTPMLAYDVALLMDKGFAPRRWSVCVCFLVVFDLFVFCRGCARLSDEVLYLETAARQRFELLQVRVFVGCCLCVCLFVCLFVCLLFVCVLFVCVEVLLTRGVKVESGGPFVLSRLREGAAGASAVPAPDSAKEELARADDWLQIVWGARSVQVAGVTADELVAIRWEPFSNVEYA
jgi:hypothetical protein